MREPLPSSYTPQLHCPHCNKELPQPPLSWQWSAPWQCSHCGGAYGTCESDGMIVRELFPIADWIEPFSPIVGWNIANRFCFYSGQQNYYVYALCYPSGLPFYIGSGTNSRALAHEEEALKDTNTNRRQANRLKINAIRWLIDHNEPVWYHFLALVPARERALQIETAWIDRLGIRGRGGILTNRVQPGLNQAGLDEADEYPITPPPVPKQASSEEFRIRHAETIRSTTIRSTSAKFAAPFLHPEIVIPPPATEADTSSLEGLFMHKMPTDNCPACGQPGQWSAKMKNQKILCSNCGHYIELQSRKVDDGAKRMFFETMPQASR